MQILVGEVFVLVHICRLYISKNAEFRSTYLPARVGVDKAENEPSKIGDLGFWYVLVHVSKTGLDLIGWKFEETDRAVAPSSSSSESTRLRFRVA